MNKLKNKFNKDRGYVCGGVGDRGCGCDVGLGIVVRGIVYCQKCYHQGIGEVVEWIRKHHPYISFLPELEAKLKEWG